MAMNSPSSPIEATRNAGMMAAVMAARDRERTHDELDERERDRLEQEKLMQEQQRSRNQRGFIRRMLDRLPF